MITAAFTQYHNDYHEKKYIRDFKDLDALEEYIFGSMHVPYNNHMWFDPDQRISYMPDGWPVEGGQYNYWVTEIKNEQGILYRAFKHCSKVVRDWMIKCEARVKQPEVFVP